MCETFIQEIEWPDKIEYWKYVGFKTAERNTIYASTLVEYARLMVESRTLGLPRDKTKMIDAQDEYEADLCECCCKLVRNMFYPEYNEFLDDLTSVIVDYAMEDYWKNNAVMDIHEYEHPLVYFVIEAFNKYKHLHESAKATYKQQ